MVELFNSVGGGAPPNDDIGTCHFLIARHLGPVSEGSRPPREQTEYCICCRLGEPRRSATTHLKLIHGDALAARPR